MPARPASPRGWPPQGSQTTPPPGPAHPPFPAHHAEVHVGRVELQVDLAVDGRLAVLVVVLAHLGERRSHGAGLGSDGMEAAVSACGWWWWRW